MIPLDYGSRQLTAAPGHTALPVNDVSPGAPVAAPPPPVDASMHDMLRIMDVASAMRRERETALSQLDLATAKQRLHERLLATAAAAGETVTPAEVDAAIEQYFAQQHRYQDPPRGWASFWAHAWVLRGPLLLLAAMLAAGTLLLIALAGAFGGGAGAPRPPTPSGSPAPGAGATPGAQPVPTAEPRAQLLAVWERVQRTAAALAKVAADDDARGRVQQLLTGAEVAYGSERLDELRAAEGRLRELGARLEEQYVVRVVSRPGEDTGVERRNAGRTSGLYLIVEAVGTDGRKLSRLVRDGEDGAQRSVTRWGEQVPEAVWNRIAADKQADGVVDEAEFARKERGRHDETMVMKDGAGAPLRRGRQITRW